MRHFDSHMLRQIHFRISLGAFFICALGFSAWTQAGELSACATDHIDEWAQVGYIYDGDTIKLSDGRRVRFIAINAPEVAHKDSEAQPLAEAAKHELARLLPTGSRVGLRFGVDHYGPHHRVLAHIFDSQRRNISATLVREGYAYAIAIPRNLWQSRCYFRQEQIARAKHLGIWSLAYYAVKKAEQLHTREGGFYRVSGRITHVGNSRRSLWLDINKYFAVRIPRKDLHYFSKDLIDNLLGKQITVRGWAHFYDHKLNLSLTHPAMLEKAQ